jgi:methanobactin biosynthesis MbnP-like protein
MTSRTLSLLIAAATLTAACGGKPAPDACLAPSQLDQSAPVTHFRVQFVAGTSPLIPGTAAAMSRSVSVTPSKARFYVSNVALIADSGERAPTELVDANGVRLPDAVTLVDFEQPDSMNLYLRAPAGHYGALSLSVGVPATCESGERLNHSDASAMPAPLDVDSDMYWSWNSGYVFLKFEGQLADGNKFVYHIGDDKRFATVELPQDITIAADGAEGPELIADFNQLLTSASGEARPDIMNADQRDVHSGDLADALADNVRSSSFLRLAPAHQ